MASLTLPTRPPFINTFKELLDQEDIIIVGSAHNSFMAYLSQTKDSVMMVQIYSMLFEVLCTSLILILSLQELNKRMLRQGYNETHLYKPDYPSFTHKVIFSPTLVVRLQELQGAKLFNDIWWSTASGKFDI